MRRWLPVVVVALFAAAGATAQQSARPERVAFATVSVKANTSGASGPGVLRLQPGGDFSATNATVRELIQYAYQRHVFDSREVTGGAAWIDAERFDVVAKAGAEHQFEPDGATRRMWAMLRAMLEDRFKLELHEENRERPVYALMLASADGALGPKLQKTDVDCGSVMRGERPATPPGEGPPCSHKTPPGRLFANTVSMATIASLLSRHVDRPVIDRTGLMGRYNIELEASEIQAAPDYKPGPSDLVLPPAKGPSIFIAVRQQLGLKLEPQLAPIPVLVIDHVERPRVD